MRLPVLAAALSLALVAGAATPLVAAPCKDARGKFVKCPPPPAAKAVRCKAKGKFARCGTPGAMPVK